MPGIFNETKREVYEGKLPLDHGTLCIVFTRSERPV